MINLSLVRFQILKICQNCLKTVFTIDNFIKVRYNRGMETFCLKNKGGQEYEEYEYIKEDDFDPGDVVIDWVYDLCC